MDPKEFNADYIEYLVDAGYVTRHGNEGLQLEHPYSIDLIQNMYEAWLAGVDFGAYEGVI